MSPTQAAEISKHIGEAKDQYDKAVQRATSGITNPQDIDGIIAGVTEAHKKILDTLQTYKELLSK